jgi:hypothetical protein
LSQSPSWVRWAHGEADDLRDSYRVLWEMLTKRDMPAGVFEVALTRQDGHHGRARQILAATVGSLAQSLPIRDRLWLRPRCASLLMNTTVA